MIYTEAQIIRKGYQFEKAKTPAKALVYRRWLSNAMAADQTNQAEILSLWDKGRAEGRAR